MDVIMVLFSTIQCNRFVLESVAATVASVLAATHLTSVTFWILGSIFAAAGYSYDFRAPCSAEVVKVRLTHLPTETSTWCKTGVWSAREAVTILAPHGSGGNQIIRRGAGCEAPKAQNCQRRSREIEAPKAPSEVGNVEGISPPQPTKGSGAPAENDFGAFWGHQNLNDSSRSRSKVPDGSRGSTGL